MRTLLIVLTLVGAGLSAWAQPSTNLNATLTSIWVTMPPSIQQNTEDTWTAYQRAVKRSPEFSGVTTNLVYDETGTNVIGTVVTTNHPPMSFSTYFLQSLQQEKIGRVVESRNQSLRAEMYGTVGKAQVDQWAP